MIQSWHVAVAVNVIIFAAAWGYLCAQVAGLTKTGEERHEDNRNRLERIEEKVDRINGTVAVHEGILKSKPKGRTRR